MDKYRVEGLGVVVFFVGAFVSLLTWVLVSFGAGLGVFAVTVFLLVKLLGKSIELEKEELETNQRAYDEATKQEAQRRKAVLQENGMSGAQLAETVQVRDGSLLAGHDEYYIDTAGKKIALFGSRNNPPTAIIDFGSIVGVDRRTKSETSSTSVSQKQGAVGRAVVGGMVGGDVGALVGAATAKEVGTATSNTRELLTGLVIYTKDISRPKVEVRTGDDWGSTEYLENVYASLIAIINSER